MSVTLSELGVCCRTRDAYGWNARLYCNPLIAIGGRNSHCSFNQSVCQLAVKRGASKRAFGSRHSCRSCSVCFPQDVSVKELPTLVNCSVGNRFAVCSDADVVTLSELERLLQEPVKFTVGATFGIATTLIANWSRNSPLFLLSSLPLAVSVELSKRSICPGKAVQESVVSVPNKVFS